MTMSLSNKPSILVIDDDALILESMRLTMTSRYTVTTSESCSNAVDKLKSQKCDVILLDVKMPESNGIGHLKKIKEVAKDIPIIMFSGVSDISQVIECIKSGAFSYVVKGRDLKELYEAIDVAILSTKVEQKKEPIKNTQKNENTQCIIGNSIQASMAFEVAREIAPARDISILITGETGVGKEVLSRYIHQHSGNPDAPFIAINCGAIPETLIESELFGHEAGAFTDAIQKRIGKFEAANGGTIFLDEISTMPIHLQVKLLRVLQEKKIERIGSTVSIPINIRLIAASNTNIENDINEGKFRQDLYYRIRGIEINLPALRDRPEDFELFLTSFINFHSEKYKIPPKKVSKSLINLLKMAPWKGNIRELYQFAEVLVFLLKKETEITIQNFPKQCLTRLLMDYNTLKKNDISVQKAIMRRSIEAFQGNITATAQFFNIDRSTIYRLISDDPTAPT
jgi:DNA-binding NtrC family response regulator